MCNLKKHKCYCGEEYKCEYPNWVCPTQNEDEDQNLCDDCLEKSAKDVTAWENYQDEYFEDEEFFDD